MDYLRNISWTLGESVSTADYFIRGAGYFIDIPDDILLSNSELTSGDRMILWFGENSEPIYDSAEPIVDNTIAGILMLLERMLNRIVPSYNEDGSTAYLDTNRRFPTRRVVYSYIARIRDRERRLNLVGLFENNELTGRELFRGLVFEGITRIRNEYWTPILGT